MPRAARARPSIPAESAPHARPLLPEVSELDAVRHYTSLSQHNFLDRHALLSARLVHDEIQPARVQFSWRCCRSFSRGIR